MKRHDEAAASAELDARKDPAHPLYREPAYGKSAERYNAERELGRRVLEILTVKRLHMNSPLSREMRAGFCFDEIEEAARALGLLDSKEANRG